MKGSILTVNTLWNNFSVPEKIGVETVGEKKVGSIVLSDLMIEGRKVSDGNVEIYAILAKGVQTSVSPAIFLLSDLDSGIDKTLVVDLAKQGYTVLAIDVSGEREDSDKFTFYPNSLSHAQYKNAKDNLLSVKSDVRSTCWYEWTAAAKYAVKYLKSLPFVTKIGGFGIGKAGTALWHISGTENTLDCVCLARNAGWHGYSGIEKFGGMVEPQFSDEMYKYLAGVEPQAYAMQLKCPVFVLSATNDKDNDVDRAYDTVSRVGEEIYSAISYSVGNIDNIGFNEYKNALIFFKSYLWEGTTDELPKESEIKLEIEEGKARICVRPYEKGFKKVCVYVAEEITNPALRSWQKITEYKKQGDVFIFDYNPYPMSGIVFAFATVSYSNGITVGTNILAKRFNENEITPIRKNNILYSSRFSNAESIFTNALPMELSPNNININDKETVKVKKGPMGIEGVTCCRGLLTYKVGMEKCKPLDGAMLMLDVYCKEKAILEIKLISETKDNKTEYVTRIEVLGGDVWHNVKTEVNKFKTEEGMPLKSYKNITSTQINVIGTEYLINNALWV